MTLDQVFFRLAKRDGLRKRGGARQVAPSTVLGPTRGRTAAGKPLTGRVAGVSKARQMADAAKAKKAAETEAAPPKRRRKRGI